MIIFATPNLSTASRQRPGNNQRTGHKGVEEADVPNILFLPKLKTYELMMKINIDENMTRVVGKAYTVMMFLYHAPVPAISSRFLTGRMITLVYSRDKAAAAKKHECKAMSCPPNLAQHKDPVGNRRSESRADGTATP